MRIITVVQFYCSSYQLSVISLGCNIGAKHSCWLVKNVNWSEYTEIKMKNRNNNNQNLENTFCWNHVVQHFLSVCTGRCDDKAEHRSRIVTSPSGNGRKHIIVLLSAAIGQFVYSNLFTYIYYIIIRYIGIIFLFGRYYIFFECFVLYTTKTPSSGITSFRAEELFLIICLFSYKRII